MDPNERIIWVLKAKLIWKWYFWGFLWKTTNVRLNPLLGPLCLINKKRIRSRAQKLGPCRELKTTAKNHENLRYWKNLKYQKFPPDRTKIALARSFFEQMTSNLFYLDHESIYFATIALNWILSLFLGIQFWFKVKKSKFRDTQIFRRTNFAGPWTGP